MSQPQSVSQIPDRRPPELRRSWLFLPGADSAALKAGAASGADVLIQELEDFTPLDLRPAAHRLAPEVLGMWRVAGKIAAVRINPLDDGGMNDLVAVMPARPDVVALPKVSGSAQIRALDEHISRLERECGISEGRTEILPNIEYARGLVNTIEIVESSDRVRACLLASEDLAADLGAVRGQDGLELQYCRQRFIVECRAAGVVAVDCPYTWENGEKFLVDETGYARRLGYLAKSCVHASHAGIINNILAPDSFQIAEARTIAKAFETARAAGMDRVSVGGSLVEVPTYLNAKRLLERAELLARYEEER